METSEVLNTAADLIERDGWKQGSGWPGCPSFTGTLCAEGAIMAALGDTWSLPSLVRLNGNAAYAAVKQHVGITKGFIFQWNDEEGRTAAEVIEVLRAAAVIAAARESVAAYALGAVGA